MPSYLSEIDYFGVDADEFIEVAVPTGTNVTGYTVQLYDAGGNLTYSFPLGTVQATMAGHDVYVIDSSNPSFDSSGDPTGVMYPDDALALVDGTGTVLQFVSWDGNTVTATGGDASGLTSTSVGSAATSGQSLQSDDGGATYYTQTSQNKGTIPACYARGTWIDTVSGPVRIENLRVGDVLRVIDGPPAPVRWIWTKSQTFQRDDPSPPVRFSARAAGPLAPTRDLVVSSQHRIALGLPKQFEEMTPALVPAKALADLRGVHVMHERDCVQWWHIVCDRHVLIRANGLVSETMLLGPRMFRSFTPAERRSLRKALGHSHLTFGTFAPALPCLNVRATEQRLRRVFHRAKMKKRRCIRAPMEPAPPLSQK